LWHLCAIGRGEFQRLALCLRTSLGDSDVGVHFWHPPVHLVRGAVRCQGESEEPVAKLLQQLWTDERGQDIAEYAVMLAVILVIVVGTIRLIGSNANNVFSQVGSAIQ
jgi:Flp pilus assembly pilin Flp